jgi:Ca-activated chloride channel family protein
MRCYWLLLLVPSVVMAKTENGAQLYNNGVAAYESNDFLRAAALFENATASADRTLQQRALYNLGNATYRLGEMQPVQAQQLWQRALKNYETALAIDPKDADAKFNHDFVKKKLEELKMQQQQNQKHQQDKKQDQKQDDQQQQQEHGQQQQNPQDKQSDQQQSKQSESQEQQKQEQQQKDAQQKEQAQQEKQSQPQQQTQEESGQPQNYEKMQAAALLDRLREDERNWNFFPEVQMKDLKDSGKPAKDW